MNYKSCHTLPHEFQNVTLVPSDLYSINKISPSVTLMDGNYAYQPLNIYGC